MARRKHSTIAQLPAEVLDQVNAWLTTSGVTYQDVVDKLGELGITVSHSAVGRYGAGFAARLQRLRETREQVTAILEQSGELGATDLQSAAVQLVTDQIVQFLLTTDGLESIKHKDLLQGIAALTRATANLETVRTKARAEAAKDVDDALGAVELSEEVKARIRKAAYGG